MIYFVFVRVRGKEEEQGTSSPFEIPEYHKMDRS